MKTFKITPQLTKKESNSLEIYFQEVSKLNRKGNLTVDEEIALAIRIQNGDKKAEHELIERNLKFVISVAKYHQIGNIQLSDIINEGNLGLILAAKKYDHKKGYKFISYAVWWIRQSIFCYLDENSRTIRLPLNQIGKLNKIKKAKNKLEQILERTPTTEEVLDELNDEVKIDDYNRIISIDAETESLSAQFSYSSTTSGEILTLEDVLTNDNDNYRTDDEAEKNDLKNLLRIILKQMSYKERVILELYYGLNGQNAETIDVIGEKMNLTTERIRQIKLKAIRKLSCQRIKNLIRPYNT